MSAGISAFLITLNEADRLPRTLEALAWADEIVVVDSGSTDGTTEIAKAAGARVEHRDFDGYGPQKVFAEGLCTHDWLLNVDADEVVTPELAEEIRLAAGEPGAWRVRILNVYPGDARPRPWANDYNVVRLYHRSVGGYRDHKLFDRVEHSGAARQLTSPIWHFPLTSWAHFVEKENWYSSYAAEAGQARSRTGLIWRLPFEMPLSFLKFFVLRRHFTGGWKGFMFSLTAAFARTLRLSKMLARAEDAEKK
ncbi:MAG: glycosyltransferase family 2 protein [Pseudomonadota bacterium]